MLIPFTRRWRRAKLIAQPFPDEWRTILLRNVAHYHWLTAEEQKKLQDDLRIFIAEKNWEGCGGLRLTDEIKVTIAAQACLLLLGLKHNYFERVLSILVYPRAYRAVDDYPEDDEPIDHSGEGRLGEAWYRGPVVLSWADVLADGRSPRGKNLVYHEFAHQLDMLDGLVDGTPPLETKDHYRRWGEVMTAEYRQLIAAAEHGRPTLLDPYGTVSEGEFFAVATECFFDQPVELARRHPHLYEVLRDYFHQDPAARFAKHQPTW